MAEIGKTRSLLNSIVAFFRSSLQTEGFTRVQFLTGDPEDKNIVLPNEYQKLTSAQQRDAVRVPCFIINADTIRDGDDFGIGEAETWVQIPCVIDIYAESEGQKYSLGDYIQETLEDKKIQWYDYSTTPNPSASNLLGTIDFKNISVRCPRAQAR